MIAQNAHESRARSPLHVDYEALLADYERGLVDRLRGFGAGAPELDLWVPDEDPLQSLVNMLDAAASVGSDAISIVIGPSTLNHIDLRTLLEKAGTFGNAAVRQTTGGMTLELTGLSLPQSDAVERAPVRPKPVAREVVEAVEVVEVVEAVTFPDSLGPSYSIARPGRMDSPSLPVPGDNQRGSHALTAGLELGLVVDEDGLVVAAGFGGSPNTLAADLLWRLCDDCRGLPILEVRDHAILRLEYALRVDRDARACAGVVIPEASSPAFAILQRLLRETAAPLLPNPAALNEYDAGPSGFWLSLGTDERTQLVGDALRDVAESFGLHHSAIALQAIQFDVRVVVGLVGVDSMLTIPILVAAERALKDEVEPRLELVVEELRDRNKKRRLAIVTTPAEN